MFWAIGFVTDVIGIHAILGVVNNNDCSHIVHVPTDPNVFFNPLISTPISTSDGEDESGFAAGAIATTTTMVLQTELCQFSGAKIYLGKRIKFVHLDSQVFLFANSKCKRYFHNQLKVSHSLPT